MDRYGLMTTIFHRKSNRVFTYENLGRYLAKYLLALEYTV